MFEPVEYYSLDKATQKLVDAARKAEQDITSKFRNTNYKKLFDGYES